MGGGDHKTRGRSAASRKWGASCRIRVESRKSERDLRKREKGKGGGNWVLVCLGGEKLEYISFQHNWWGGRKIQLA